jgi:uncharacterized protein
MKIKLEELYKKKKIMYKYETNKFEQFDYKIVSPFKISYTIKLLENLKKIEIEIEINGSLLLNCDRCLEQFSYNMKINNIDIYELDEFDNEIDLDKETIENIILFLPSKYLCKEDCKGLCPNCGTNLNKDKCFCNQI